MPQLDEIESYKGRSQSSDYSNSSIEKYYSKNVLPIFPRIDDVGVTTFRLNEGLKTRANSELKGIIDSDVYISVVYDETYPDKVFDYEIVNGRKCIEINTHRLGDESFRRAAYQAAQCVNMLERGTCPEEFLRRGIAARMAQQKFGAVRNDTPDTLALEIVDMLEIALKRKINPIDVISGKFKLKDAVSAADYEEFEKVNEAFGAELKNSGGIVNCDFKRALALEHGTDKNDLEQEDLESEIATYRTFKGTFTVGIKNGVNPQSIANAMNPNRVAKEQLDMVLEMAKKKAAEDAQKEAENPQNNFDSKRKDNIIGKG